jgi:hypothetical protein
MTFEVEPFPGHGAARPPATRNSVPTRSGDAVEELDVDQAGDALGVARDGQIVGLYVYSKASHRT